MNVIGIIPARGGSKGLKDKNIFPLCGRPLIEYTIDAALESAALDRLIVSTDSKAIAEVAEKAGAEIPFIRPTRLACDVSSTFPVVEHALDWIAEHDGVKYEYMMLLQPTAPLRIAADIIESIEVMERNASEVDSLVSLGKIDDPHPLKTKKIVDGRALPYFDRFAPSDMFRRQDFPPAYFLNGAIYICRIEEMMERKALLGPKTMAFVMPPKRSVNIDDHMDILLAETVMKHSQSTDNHGYRMQK